MKRRYPQSNPCLKHSKKFKCVTGARGRECLLIVRKTAVIVRTVPHDSMRRPLQSRSKRIRRRRRQPHRRQEHRRKHLPPSSLGVGCSVRMLRKRVWSWTL